MTIDLHTSKQYFVARNTFGGLVEGGAVLLNLDTEEYIGIDCDAASQLASAVTGWSLTDGEPQSSSRSSLQGSPKTSADAPAANSDLVSELLSMGYLTNRPEQAKILTSVSVHAADSLFDTAMVMGRGSSRSGHRSSLVAAILWAMHTVRHGSMRWLTTHAANGSPADLREEIDVEAILPLLRSFRMTRTWFYSADGLCLLDSVALGKFLLWQGLSPTLVIGVKTRPFGAHAWVQIGSFVLNDKVENVRMHTPILAAQLRSSC